MRKAINSGWGLKQNNERIEQADAEYVAVCFFSYVERLDLWYIVSESIIKTIFLNYLQINILGSSARKNPSLYNNL